MADAVDVFLIVAAGRDNIFGGFAEGFFDGGSDRGDDGGVLGCHGGVDLLDFADFVVEIGAF